VTSQPRLHGHSGRPKRGKPPTLSAITGKKHLRSLLQLRKKLRKAHTHPNRSLYYDDVLTALLLAFFNPVMRSRAAALRTLPSRI